MIWSLNLIITKEKRITVCRILEQSKPFEIV